MEFRPIGLLVLAFIGLACANSISLRSNIERAEYEPFQVFFACAGASFDFGAGIALTPKHILTTASLIRGFHSWNVGFGNSSIAGLKYIESSVAYLHPGFNSQSMNNNLGIIVLPRSLPSDIVSPIALPSVAGGSTTVVPRLGQEGRLVGFGITDETKVAEPAPNAFLKTVYLSVRDDNTCAERFPTMDLLRNFCANDGHPETMNVCKGDVGSAFVVTLRGKQILAGISSIVSEACTPSDMATFVRIEKYIPWISGVTQRTY